MRALLLFACSVLSAEDLLIRNAIVHPVSGPKIDNASILVIDGKIADVGAKIAPPKNAKNLKTIDAKGQHVYPGMIDSATEIGLSEISAVRETVDVGELGEFNPQLRALIAINPSSEHIPVVRANGITSAITLPMSTRSGGGRGSAPTGIIGGQAALVHLNGWTWEEMEINRSAALHVRFPAIAPQSSGAGGGRRGGTTVTFPQALQTKDKQIRELKEFFQEARRYKTAKDAGSPAYRLDHRFEAMLPVVEGKVPLLVAATREREIREAIEWADQEKVRIILAGVRKPGKALSLIASKKIPVIVAPTLAAPLEEDDPYDEPYVLPNELFKAGVKFAFGSFGNEFSRNLPYQAAMAVNFGLPYEEGLKSITLTAAEIWGAGDRLGSIEKGKAADLVVTDGDVLEARTHVNMLFINGRPVDLESKHTRLYQKYLSRN